MAVVRMDNWSAAIDTDLLKKQVDLLAEKLMYGEMSDGERELTDGIFDTLWSIYNHAQAQVQDEKSRLEASWRRP